MKIGDHHAHHVLAAASPLRPHRCGLTAAASPLRPHRCGLTAFRLAFLIGLACLLLVACAFGDVIRYPPPTTPTNFAATPITGGVRLTWSASGYAASYNLYRGTQSGAEGTTPYQSGLTGTSYTDTGTSSGTTYYYTLQAVQDALTSNPSAEASAAPLASAPVLTSIVVSPASAALNLNGTQQFTAVAKDQNGNPLTPQPAFTWSYSGVGTIGGSTGLYSAGTTAGSATVKAASGTVSGTATVTVTNAAPTVATAAAAAPNPVTGTTTALSVLGADDGGEANLTYIWVTTGTPPAAVIFSASGTNAAKNTTATFREAGTYSFQVTITDAGGLTATSAVTVTVNQTLTAIVVTPNPITLNTNGTQQFTAVANDQFGMALTTQPAFTWTSTGVGMITTAGLYSAGTTAGTATVTAKSGTVSGNAAVTVNATSSSISLSSIYLGPNGIVAGNSSAGTVIFSGTASNPVSVACSSDDLSITVPASLPLPANQSSLQFNYVANDVFFPTTATVTVSYNGKTQTAQITVQPAIQLTASATGNDVNGQGKISLFWTGIANATGYNIYRQSTATGAFIRIASNVTTQDSGPVLMPTYVYTDTGLTNGNSYAYYVVAVISNGSEKGTSNVETDTPDLTGIPWDTGNASSIVAAVQAEAAAAVIPDPEDPDQTPEPVGTLMIASPDGIVYMGNLPDGSPAQAFPAAGFYDATSNQIIYSDGTAGIGSPDAMNVPDSAAQPNSLSSNATVGEKPLHGKFPTGITRQIQSQPGFAGMAATVALPDASDAGVVYLADNGSGLDQNHHKKNYNSVGDIYTGGHIVFPASAVAASMEQTSKIRW